MIEKFQTVPDFPFDMYFENTNQYVAAMEYWMAVLRGAEGFDEADWSPRERPVEIEDDMYLGKAIDITSARFRKEIQLQTWSVPGDANMLFKENSGLTTQEYKALKVKFGPDFTLADNVLAGMSYQEALTEAQDEAQQTPAKIWVEDATTWHEDPAHQEGGYDVAVERLVLAAQISADGEAAALHALGLFLKPGSAMHRVGSAFPDGFVTS